MGKLSFTQVAKQSKIAGLSTKKFKDKAFAALRAAGYGKTEATGILSGAKKMEHSTLKKVFYKLKTAKIIKKGAGAVKEYISDEISKQEIIARFHLRRRADEIETEKATAAVATTSAKDKKSTITPNIVSHLPAVLPSEPDSGSSRPSAALLAKTNLSPGSAGNLDKSRLDKREQDKSNAPTAGGEEEPEDLIID